jgi:hypothetical protein
MEVIFDSPMLAAGMTERGDLGRQATQIVVAFVLHPFRTPLRSTMITEATPGQRCTSGGSEVRHRTNWYLNNHLEQDHRGIKQRIRPMGGFKSVESATRFCRVHDEVRNFLRPRSYWNEVVSPAQRRILYTARTRILLTSLAAA